MKKVVFDVIKIIGLKIAKHFTSYVKLLPNSKVIRRKVLSSKILKGSNGLKMVLKNAAKAIGIFSYIFTFILGCENQANNTTEKQNSDQNVTIK
ncbi:hypothetical protein [Wocania ichthyoenteri]|uniref:hypothetical protein n=1 Tax=Wocania ichthyoenteri TaxID=1230531 RepID=UPI00053DB1D0|nr:hypothetical protein [Wocania ichthyoenteri]